MRNTKFVEILGEKILLSERDAYDVMLLKNAKFQGDGDTRAILEMVNVIHCGLKYCIRELKWYQFRKQIIYRWKFRLKNLLRKLSINGELPELALEVYRLEGIDVDKFKVNVTEEKKKILNELTPN